MIGCEGNANLLPLPVVKKTFQPDMDHDVVAHNTVRWDEARESLPSFLCPAAGSTNPDCLPKAEASMPQCYAGALPGFRNPHGLAANTTRSIVSLCNDECARNTARPLSALFLDLSDRLSEAGYLRERARATVFFTP